MALRQRDLLNGQSSPGTLQVGQHPSKGTRQIPHTSSSGSPFSSVLPVSHCHWAMACHRLTMTFMVLGGSGSKTRLFVSVYATGMRHRRAELRCVALRFVCLTYASRQRAASGLPAMSCKEENKATSKIIILLNSEKECSGLTRKGR